MSTHNHHIRSDVAIVGNGIAGNTAAEAILRHDPSHRVIMISEESVPLYSACILGKYMAGEIERSRVFLKQVGDYKQPQFLALLGSKVVDIDLTRNRLRLSDERVVSFEKLILATGSKPIVPDIPGLSLKGVFVFKSVFDADSILAYPGRNAVIIGSGPIGVEAAVALRKKGHNVTIIELLPWILPKVFNRSAAEFLTGVLESKGIEVSTSERLLSIVGTTAVEGIITDKREIPCDILILAIGMKPRVELCKMLEIGKLGGVRVDENMRTNMPNVYACGDCAESVDPVTGSHNLTLLWHNAKQQALVAGLQCMGIRKSYAGPVNMVAIDVFGVFAGSIGANTSSAEARNPEVVESKLGKSRVWLVLTADRLIGAQFVGDIQDFGLLLPYIKAKYNTNKLFRVYGGELARIPSAHSLVRYLSAKVG